MYDSGYCYICMEKFDNLEIKFNKKNNNSKYYEKYLFQLPNFSISKIKFVSHGLYQLECGHSTCFKCILLSLINCGDQCPYCRTKISKKEIINILSIFDQDYQKYNNRLLIMGLNQNNEFLKYNKIEKLTRKKTELFRAIVIQELIQFYLTFFEDFINGDSDSREEYLEVTSCKSIIIDIMINLIRKNKWFLKRIPDFKKVFISKLDEIEEYKCKGGDGYSNILSKFWKNELQSFI